MNKDMLQPELPFNQISQEMAVDTDASERIRPEGIPEDAWIAIEAFRQRVAARESFSLGFGRKATREQLQAEADEAYLRSRR